MPFMPSPLKVGDQLTFVSIYIVVLTNGGPPGDPIDWTLTHWGRVTHICISRLTITGSDNGLLHGRGLAIIWTNAGILLIGPLGTNFSENLIEILTVSFTKMRLKVSSAKWQPFCLGLNMLTHVSFTFLDKSTDFTIPFIQYDTTVVTLIFLTLFLSVIMFSKLKKRVQTLSYNT